MVFLRSALLPFLLLAAAQTATAVEGMAIDPATCLGCHGDRISVRAFADSVHGKNACTSCHDDITDLVRHMRKEIKVHKVQCERCHKKVNSEHFAGVHAAGGVMCADCHTDIHSHRYWKNDKRIVVAKCIQCHDREALYQRSIHGRGVAAGNMDSAACNDCHGLHDIKTLGDPKSHANREFHTGVCLKCHSDERMMARNKVINVAVKTYMESYHGKNYRLGFPERVAGCADCHTAHAVLPAEDPQSSVSTANLARTCGQCHARATTPFTRFYAHGDHSDRERYPLLYWTYLSMTGLLVAVFQLFWLHTLLWMFRAFVDNRKKAALLAAGEEEPDIPGRHTIYRRFGKRHIILHLMVILSFLGLSLTGLPLRFSDQRWAKALMDLYGGATNAGMIHRACAVITFAYFALALIMSAHYLFVRRDLPGNWLRRLFGPDSLCPNLKDLKDIAGMVKWFLFRGPKPAFERWTYWEKFDFLAVFWGMFAIGGSGLMLWFPELFGSFLPGWMFNVATIIHSDEALLATGFIFTVHFFNTHFRPEKFPMDFVIFNGQLSKEEMINERGEQWGRLEREGITETLRVEKPSGILYDFLFKGFGFLAVSVGIILTLLMVYAFLVA